MLLEIILAISLGLLIGTFTGLTPGIHINLVSAILLGFSSFFLLHFAPLTLILFLVTLATTHTFIDFIPSIFLGAPDADNTALSVLPGHEMLLHGKGYEAIVLTLYGCLSGLVVIIFFTPLFIIFLPKTYPYAERIMPFILILTSFFLIYFEKSSRKFAFIIFLLSGFLGLTTLTLPLKESLLPLFTGLFGVSSLLTSIAKKQTLPVQEIKKLREIKIAKKSYLKSLFASLIASPLCSFLPGLGTGQAAVIGSQIVEDLDRKEFLILLGSINVIVTGLSFVTLFAIAKTRTGVAAAVNELTTLSLNNIIIITLTIIFVGICSFFLALYLSKLFSKIISRVNYQVLSLGIILLLFIVCLIFSGILGLLVMLVSTCLGLTCIYLGVRRTHLMGCLIIPSIVLYLL